MAADVLSPEDAAGAVDTVSATSDSTGAGPPNPTAAHSSASPDPGQTRGRPPEKGGHDHGYRA
jgi:hypothetical protein